MGQGRADTIGMSASTLDVMSLTVNGDAMRLPGGTTLTALIKRVGLDTRKLAVELNREIVPRSTYGFVTLHDGDVLEIVHFIGGG